MWKMWEVRVGLLLLLGIGLSACAGEGSFSFPAVTPPAPYPPPGYAHRVDTPQVGLFYNCVNAEPSVLRLEGLAFNMWNSQPLRFFEFELAGVDASERTVSEAEAEGRDMQLFTGQSTSFQMELRPTGKEVRYDMYYQYQFMDGDHKDLIVGPIVAGAYPKHVGARFLARDACSPTQHLTRY
jgi:hypothetical protein